MRQGPKISVVMPVYNEEKYIGEAIESILHQTFEDFEFIIINDGSTDRTKSIISSFSDARIKVLTQTNKGLTQSLNKGLSVSTGEYIARMDGNDISLPCRLQKQVEYLESHPRIGLVGAYYLNIDEKGTEFKTYRYATDDKEIRRILWTDCPFCHSLVIYRTQCITEVGDYRERIGPAEDYDLWFRISEKFLVANIPEPLHKVRVTVTGITLKNRINQIRAACLVRYLAQQRKDAGRDDLDQMKDEEIGMLLDSLLPKTKKNVRSVSYSTAFYLAEVLYCTHDYFGSFRHLVSAFCLNPFSVRALDLFGKILLCSILRERGSKFLKRVYRNLL